MILKVLPNLTDSMILSDEVLKDIPTADTSWEKHEELCQRCPAPS